MPRVPSSGTARGWLAAVAAASVLAGVTVVSLPVSLVQLPERPIVELPLGRSATALPYREQAVQELLDRRAAALFARDEAAFLASVDPKAPAEFRERQRALFHHLAEVPVTEWSYQIDDSVSLTPPAVPESPDNAWAPRVTLTYALARVDPLPTRRSMGYLFVQRGDSWYLAGDEELRDQGRTTWRGPWDFGPCRVTATRQGLVIGHDANRELAERIIRVVDESVTEVTEVWGPGWTQQVAVLLPESREELRALVGPEFAVDGIAAVAVADHVDAVAGRVEGPRVVFNHDTVGGLSDVALRVVLQHEITHVAARAATVDGAPMWMLEGFADYVGYRESGLEFRDVAPDLVRQVRTKGVPTSPPSDQDFRLAGQQLDLAYQQSWSLVAHLVELIGEERTVAVYRQVAGSASPSSVDAALQEKAGMSTQELVKSWGERLARIG